MEEITTVRQEELKKRFSTLIKRYASSVGRPLLSELNSHLASYHNDRSRRKDCPLRARDCLRTLKLLGLDAPTKYGGLGLSELDVSIAFALLASSYPGYAGLLSSHLRVSSYLYQTLSPRLLSTLESLVMGRTVACHALSEIHARKEVRSLRTRAQLAGHDMIIDGDKTFVTGALEADLIGVVAISSATGLPLIAVIDKETEGISIGDAYTSFGLEDISLCPISFHQCRVDRNHALITDDYKKVSRLLERTSRQSYLRTAARAAGAVELLLSALIEFLAEDRYLANLDSIQVRLGRLLSVRQAIWSNIVQATSPSIRPGVAANDPSTAALCKANCTEGAIFVADEAISLLGSRALTGTGPFARTLGDLYGLRVVGRPPEHLYGIAGEKALDEHPES